MHLSTIILIAVLTFHTLPSSADTYFDKTLTEELAWLKSESYQDLVIVSTRKTPEKWFTTPAAMTVITKEDIKYSPAENITDLLVRIPGLHVQQVTRHRTTVSIRDASDYYFATLLLMIDGRPTYDYLTGGPNWNLLNIAMVDIERIEIIRGSGGATWGVNSSNGVINIITKHSKDTYKTKVYTGIGTEKRSQFTFQHSAGNEKHALRVTGHAEQDEGFDIIPAKDNNELKQLAMHYDGLWGDWHHTLSGGYLERLRDDEIDGGYATVSGIRTNIMSHSKSRNQYLQWRGENKFNDSNNVVFIASYNKLNPEFTALSSEKKIDTYDIETQYQKKWGNGAETFLSYNQRHYNIVINGQSNDPNNAEIDQYAIAFNHQQPITENLKLDLGTRAERNNSVKKKWHTMPVLRLSYHATDDLFLWGSAARSYKFPAFNHQSLSFSVLEQDLGFPNKTPLIAKGNLDLEAEIVEDFQLGIRWNVANNILLEAAAYYIERKQKIALERSQIDSSQLFTQGILIMPYGNYGRNRYTTGGELSIQKTFSEQYKTQLNIAYYDEAHFYTEAVDNSKLPQLGPEFKATWSNHWQINDQLHLSGLIYWVDKYLNINDDSTISSHYRADVKLHYEVNRALDTYLTIRNLFNHDVESSNYLIIADSQKISTSYELGLVYQFH